MLLTLKLCLYNYIDKMKIKGLKITYYRSTKFSIPNSRRDQRKFPAKKKDITSC